MRPSTSRTDEQMSCMIRFGKATATTRRTLYSWLIGGGTESVFDVLMFLKIVTQTGKIYKP